MWVAKIQSTLQFWCDKFHHQNVSYNEILLYADNYVKLDPVSESLCASSRIVDHEDIMNIKSTFLEEYERLNVLLVHYIPSQPDANWCVFPSLLEEYGVCLPQQVSDLLNNRMALPGYGCHITVEQLSNPLHSSITGSFKPGHDLSLKLHKNVTLEELSRIVHKVNEFQKPLVKHLKMLIFFKLKKSALFDKYLRYYLKHFQMPQNRPCTVDPLIGPLASLPPPSPKHAISEDLPINSLENALEATSILMDKLMQGTVTYSEIIAEELEQLDIKNEFNILSEYAQVYDLSCAHDLLLDGIRSMLELFQYTTHIKNIRSVCQQYHLHNCLEDPNLLKLIEIMQEDKSKNTPTVASEKMKKVKQILSLEGETSSKCLDIFAAVPNSTAFYQFMRDKQFYGQQGQAIFLQQYRLITAQLQHEEYDETVLNHLFAAYQVISPFMDTEKSFNELMKEVTALNTMDGLMQLKTVNTNINLIKLWFSRAEVRAHILYILFTLYCLHLLQGDTLENVAKELECVIRTGTYTFHLGGTDDVDGSMLLEYEPASTAVSSPTLTPQLEGAELPSFALIESRAGSDMMSRKTWNLEQIGDFVRKLGFLDKDKEEKEGNKIKHFLHLSQVKCMH